jgi:hypothetical protein
MMKDRRVRSCDRRQQKEMPKTRFKDSNGVTVRMDRRKTTDRRVNSLDVERIDEVTSSQ